MARRDRVQFPAPLPQPAFTGLALERDVRIDLAERTVTGHVRFYSPAGKFLRSEAFEVRLSDAVRDVLGDHILKRVQNQRPELAGPVVQEDVADPDQDV